MAVHHDGSGSGLQLRDPTKPGEALHDLVAPLRMGQHSGAAGGGGMPQITLKGRIVGPRKPPAAMVEIDKHLHVLQEGSELSVPAPHVGLGSVTLKVIELNGSQVKIEIMPLRQAIVLR